MMSSPAAHSSTPAGFPLRYGPTAIAYGPGAEALRGARNMREEFAKRGFDGPWLPIADVARLPLDRFPGMVVVAPSDGLDGLDGDITALLRPSYDLVGGYRARRPDGIAAWQAGQIEHYMIGVLQVVASGDILADPAAEQLWNKACAKHELQVVSGDPKVIFKIYEAGVPGISVVAPALLGQREMLEHWAHLRTFGLRELADVDIVFNRMRELRDHYNYDARPGLRRPFGDDVPRSRYDFLIDEPHDDPRSSSFSSWVPDGAQILREVTAELVKVVPTFTSRTTRGAAKRFEKFNDDLLALRLYLKHTPEAAQIQFPKE